MRAKILLLFFAALSFLIVPAQDTRSLYQQELDRYLQYLDKSQIPTGILYDRVARIAELDTLSNVVTNNTSSAIKTSSLHFLQAWQELYDASYNQASMLKPEWLDALITEKKMNDVIPVGVLNYQFDVFDPAAMTDNLIYQTSDTMLRDVAGRSRLPYITKDIFLASPLAYKIKAGSATLAMPSNMILQNRAITLNSLVIDFGGGQVITFTPGSSAVVQLAAGNITISCTGNFSNGTQKRIYATLEVEGETLNNGARAFPADVDMMRNGPVIAPCNNNNPETITADVPFADYITGVNKTGVIRVGYYYANCSDPTLRKPVIIMDGFDPGDERKLPDIYDYLYYLRNGSLSNLGQELRLQGYDIVVVNFPNVVEQSINTPWGIIPIVIRDGGADYIERNALAIVKLITILNQRLAQNGSTEKIAIVGPSMGGLISRYALSYMEKNNQNHNCRLWLSFDSPHLGANIPIGAQYWLEFYKRVAKNKGAGDALDKQIGSVAAKQMLIHHWLAQSVTPAPAPVFRQQFLQNLQTNGLPGSNGMPQNLRKVTLTNGSGYGTTQGIACSKVLKMEGFSRNWTHFIPLIGPAIRGKATESNIYFTSDYGNNCKVFDGWFTKFIWNSKQTEEKYAQTPSNTRSYDIVPGGYYNTIEFIKKQGTISDAFSYTTFSNVVNNHSFIPTVSALALTNPNSRDWAENLSTRNLVCTGETPFNAYYTPVPNEVHVFLTAASVDWINAQLNNLPAPSPYVIQRIAGNEPICESTATFKVMNLPTGVTVTWSTPSSNISLSTTTGVQTTVSRISNGTGTLIATINTCAGTTILTYYVRVGGYSSGDYPVSGPSSASCGQVLYFTTNNLPGATSYNWFWPSQWQYISGQGTRFLTVQTPYSGYGSGMVGVRVANACDAGGSPGMLFVSVNCSGYRYYSVSPNPAASNVIVTAVEQKQKGTAPHSTISAINIYDQTGFLRKSLRSGKARTVNLYIGDLPIGIYTIEIVDGSYKERQQLSIMK